MQTAGGAEVVAHGVPGASDAMIAAWAAGFRCSDRDHLRFAVAGGAQPRKRCEHVHAAAK
jgi:hypothetical protein